MSECVDAQQRLHEMEDQRDFAMSEMERLQRERDEAREQLRLANIDCFSTQAEVSEAREENLEQARLLAMSADREEKLRDALKYVAGLDTSQDASPQQCSAVAVAMEALE